MLLDCPVVCTDFKMFQNLLKQSSIHLFLVPFIWLLIIWCNNSRMWLWQRDHFHGKELGWQDALYGLKMGKKLERSHGMYAKGRTDSWAQGGKLSWANKYCVMITTVHLFMKKILLIQLQLCKVQCESESFTPVCWGQIRNFFIKRNQEWAQKIL